MKTVYHQQKTFCGKAKCARCANGQGHGPYWYAYQTIDGQTKRTYVGKNLPPDVSASEQVLPLLQYNGVISPNSQATSNREIVRIYTLGQFRLQRWRDGEWTETTLSHAAARGVLFRLLALANEKHKTTREQLLDALWPDLDMEKGSDRLDRAVYEIRQSCDPDRLTHKDIPLLVVTREIVSLALSPTVWIDADVFEQLVNQARQIPDSQEKEQLLNQASALYGGPFLASEMHEWIKARRETLRRTWIGVQLELCDLRIERNALQSALEPLDRLLVVDPTNEAAVQRLMSVLAQMGRRAEALRAYKKLSQVLQQDYHIAPLPETRAIYNAMKQEPNAAPVSIQAKQNTASRTVFGRDHQNTFVGREQERESLRKMLLTVKTRTHYRLPNQKRPMALPFNQYPQAALLIGDVGIGKTRLVEEQGREAFGQGWTVAWTQAYTQDATISYRPWSEILRKLLATCTTTFLKQREFAPLSVLLPELGKASDSEHPQQMQLWQAVRDFLMHLSTQTPLLIVLDDIHWMDEQSQELFAYLTRHIAHHPIFLVATCRDNELAMNPALQGLFVDLQREHVATALDLEPLNDEEIIALVVQMVPVPEWLVRLIRERAAGNPFFAEELARSVDPQLQTDEEHTDGTLPHRMDLPDTIAAVLNLRLRRLTPACQRLLQQAAAVGHTFSYALLEAIMTKGGTDPSTILDVLEEALQAGLLTEQGTGRKIAYTFWHPLLTNHLYSSLSAGRRALSHRRIADVILSQDQGQDDAATLVHHLVEGGGPDDLITQYAQRAGDRASALCCYPEAERLYRLALEHLDAQHVELRMDLLERIAECTRIQGKFREALALYEEALDFYQQVPGHDALCKQIFLLSELGRAYYNVSHLVESQAYLEQARYLIEDAGITDKRITAKFAFQMAYLCWRTEHFEQALSYGNEALSSYEELYRVGQQQADLIHVGGSHTFLGSILAVIGEHTKAYLHFSRAIAIHEQCGRIRELSLVLNNLGDAHFRQSEHQQAKTCWLQGLSYAEQSGDHPTVALFHANLGLLAQRLGQHSTAESELGSAVDYFSAVHEPHGTSFFLSYLAMGMFHQGKVAQARHALARAFVTRPKNSHLPYALALLTLALFHLETVLSAPAGTDQRTFLPRASILLKRALSNPVDVEIRLESEIFLALVYVLQGEMTPAESLVRQALDECRRFGIIWLAAHAKAVVGGIWLTTQREHEARQAFGEALAMFRRHAMVDEYKRVLRIYACLRRRQQHQEAVA